MSAERNECSRGIYPSDLCRYCNAICISHPNYTYMNRRRASETCGGIPNREEMIQMSETKKRGTPIAPEEQRRIEEAFGFFRKRKTAVLRNKTAEASQKGETK